MSNEQEKTPDRTAAVARVSEYLRQFDRLGDTGGTIHTVHTDPDAVEGAALTAGDLRELYEAARTAEIVAAFMGTRNKWGYEIGEDVAEIIFEAGYPHPGNPHNRAHYEAIADALGMSYEPAEEDE